jgi:hypothetical protein
MVVGRVDERIGDEEGKCKRIDEKCEDVSDAAFLRK